MQHLFYRDIKGQPRLRRYVIAIIAILFLLIGIAITSPRSTVSDQNLRLDAPSQELITSAVLQFVPTQTATAARSECPQDPSDWTFIDVFPSDNYKRIEPACVYQELGRTAAWMLLERMGYSKPEAAAVLNFDAPPWNPVRSITGYTNLYGPKTISLVNEWPAHPDFYFWQVDRDGSPAVVISLRGCYLLEEKAKCVLALDRIPGSAVSILREHHFASHAANFPGTRSFFLFESDDGGMWSLLGQMEDLMIQIEDPAQMHAERIRMAARHGVQPWDAAWVAATYNLNMKALPREWRLYDLDERAVQSIAEELNNYLSADPVGEN